MMQNTITKQMVDELNNELEVRDSIFRIKTCGDSYSISIKKNEFMDDDMLTQVYPNQRMREFIQEFLNKRKIGKLDWNNTMTTFWYFK
jgi:hypothetical protein